MGRTADFAAKMARDAATSPGHDYYPLGVEITGFLANEYSVIKLLVTFFGGLAVLTAATNIIAKRLRPDISKSDLWTLTWFVLTGTIHLFFEGYYSINHTRLGGMQTWFGQLWKEYALSDSRYLTRDAFVLVMESTTAFLWGPISFIVAAMIPFRHPLRHPLQALVCIGQMYGLLLYYGTATFDHFVFGVSYSRPEAYYFWGYYFLCNFFWVVIPGICLYNSFEAIAEAFRIAQSVTPSKKLN